MKKNYQFSRRLIFTFCNFCTLVDKEEEIVAGYVKVLISDLENGMKGRPDFLSKVATMMKILAAYLQENPKYLTIEQYKAITIVITPPTDQEEQDTFSRQIKYLRPDHRECFRENVIGFCKAAMDVLPAYEAYWLYCLPMIHLLSDLRPLQVIFINSERPNWGDHGIEDIIEKTKLKLTGVRTFPFWKNYSVFFELDTLLPATLAACVPPQRFKECFVEGSWASYDIVIAAVERQFNLALEPDTQIDKKDEIIALCVEALLFHLAKYEENHGERFSKMSKIITIISPALETNPKYLKMEQYKAYYQSSVTPPSEPERTRSSLPLSLHILLKSHQALT
ncbi:uncharacterized protein, partial [Argopecten irradians]|uniref:uncharacterized protein n=1 Tax=Argopecten irradians TaxID=31199 RepID=UPI0037128AC9